MIVSGYSDDLSFTSATALNDGSWHFIVVTTTAARPRPTWTGPVWAAENFAATLDTLATAQGLEVGSGVQGCCGYFNGSLADIAVFPAALTSAQVTAQFAASGLGRPAAPGSPLATAGANQATVSWLGAVRLEPAGDRYLVTAVKGGTGQRGVGARHGQQHHGDRAGRRHRLHVPHPGPEQVRPGAGRDHRRDHPDRRGVDVRVTVLASGPSVFYRLADTDRGAMADSSGGGATGAYTASRRWASPGRWQRPGQRDQFQRQRPGGQRQPGAAAVRPAAHPRGLGQHHQRRGELPGRRRQPGHQRGVRGRHPAQRRDRVGLQRRPELHHVLGPQRRQLALHRGDHERQLGHRLRGRDQPGQPRLPHPAGHRGDPAGPADRLRGAGLLRVLQRRPGRRGGVPGRADRGQGDRAVRRVRPRPPGAPGSPLATAGANQATVSWSAPSGADRP